MSLKEYKPGSAHSGVIGRTTDTSEPAWPEPNRAKEGAPNVLFIVLDDTGFAQLGCYGSPIKTPNIDALAADGMAYNNMHTTALCSPSPLKRIDAGSRNSRPPLEKRAQSRTGFGATQFGVLSGIPYFRSAIWTTREMTWRPRSLSRP